MNALPLPMVAIWSFHLPLHRFVAACLREVARRCDSNVHFLAGYGISSSEGGMEKLLQLFANPKEPLPFTNIVDGSTKLRLKASLFRGLMEFPANVVSFFVRSSFVH